MSGTQRLDDTPPNVSPIIYITDDDPLQCQLLADCLERKFQADCLCRQGISLAEIIASKPLRPTVCLFNWAEIQTAAAVEKRLDPGSTPCPPHILPVLRNVARDADCEKLARVKALRGVFHAGESFESFIEGLEAILRGELRLKRPAPGERSPRPRRAKPAPSPPSVLTTREMELLRQVVSGASNREIADRMQISPHTVKTHLYNVYRKIGVPNRLQASLWAVANLRG
jgi:DNA-binding CsgD family transcriptional regulator